jgi:hypothetical protein
MKTNAALLLTLAFSLQPSALSPAFGQGTPVAPASQAEVNAGVVTKKFVSPATLAGATNLASSTTNFPAGTAVTFNGKVTLISNVFLSSLSFATNHAAVNVLNLNCTDQAVSTNNNIAYTGFNIPAEYGVTNSAWAAVIITNNGALATITVTFAGCIGDTSVIVTNQAAFLVKKYPNMGTNVVFNSLK